MKRNKPAKKTEDSITDKKLKKIIKNIGQKFNSDERETSILFDHSNKEVHIETTHAATARHFFNYLCGYKNIKWYTNYDSLRCVVPMDVYCRKPELVLKAKYRKNDV